MQDALSPSSPADSSELRIPMHDVVRFVRQLNHDLRNHLNAAELQSALLKEIAPDAETKEEVQRLREMLGEMSKGLQKISSALSSVKLTPMPYEVVSLLEDVRARAAADLPGAAGAVEWHVEVPRETQAEIDPQLLQGALVELIRNALDHDRGEGSIRISAKSVDDTLTITMREPKKGFDRDTSRWGREPFAVLKHGRYSLGLYRVRSIVDAHHGELTARYLPEDAVLETTIKIPLVRQ